MNRILSFLVLIGAAPSLTQAFAPSSSLHHVTSIAQSTPQTTQINFLNEPSSLLSRASSSTSLSERKWNFNSGRGPFGMKKNAEIWNGRVAQMAFVVVLLQELITGKGVVAGIQEGDAVGLAFLGLFVASVLGLTAFLAAKGDESDIVF